MAEYARSSLAETGAFIGISAKLAAEVLLGKVRLGYRQPEPPYLQPLRQTLMQLKKAVGPEKFDEMAESMKPAFHALADLVFDEVTGVNRKETIEDLKKLPVPYRTAVENLAAHLTGKAREARQDGPGRWQDDLWELKNRLQTMCALSVSNITLEEIRAGYHEFVHKVVDEIFAHRQSLVN